MKGRRTATGPSAGPPAPTSLKEPLQPLLLAAWFGLLAGLTEVAILSGKRFLLHRLIGTGHHVVWMTPVGELLVLAMPGLALCLLTWLRPGIVPLRAGTWLFAFLGFLGVLLLFPGLHPYATLLLAAGLALQTARFVAAHPRGFMNLIRRTTPWLALLVVGLASGVYGWRAWAEHRVLARLPAAPPGTPNVLLIVLDTVRAQSMSLYGYERPTTPQLELVARGGLRFDRALSTAPWTLPAHASLFTGHFAHALSAGWETPLDDTHSTLAEALRGRGYATAGFVANKFFCGSETGLGRGFARYEDYFISVGQVLANSLPGRLMKDDHWRGLIMGVSPKPAEKGAVEPRRESRERPQGPGLARLTGAFRRWLFGHENRERKTAARVNEDFLRWLSDADRRPFFAFLNYFDAHNPYVAPPPFDGRFQRSGTPPPSSGPPTRRVSPEDMRAEKDAYDGAVAYLDDQVGQLLRELQGRGILQNTLVIVTSDHGEEFGEHGLEGHGKTLYWEVLHVPLVISYPQHVPAGGSVGDPVSLRDIPATVMDIVEPGGETVFPGRSLAGYWTESTSNRESADPVLSEADFTPSLPEWFPLSKGDMKSIVYEEYHYIKNGDGREEIFDYTNDPWEQRDLADALEGKRQIQQFRAILDSFTNGLDEARGLIAGTSD